MQRLKTALGYGAAALTLAVLLGVPVLFPALTKGVAATGVEIDPVYTGGELARTIQRGGYRIDVHRPVVPGGPLPRAEPFVQLVWTPASALPARVSDEVDLDGDGAPDVRADFDVPADPRAALQADIVSLVPRVPTLHVSRESMATLVARVHDTVVLRFTLDVRRPRCSIGVRPR